MADVITTIRARYAAGERDMRDMGAVAIPDGTDLGERKIYRKGFTHGYTEAKAEQAKERAQLRRTLEQRRV